MKWPWSRENEGPANDLKRMSIDDYAEQFLFQGNSYNVLGNGNNSPFEFGGFAPPQGGNNKEELGSEDFEGLAGGMYRASAAVFAVHNFRRSMFSEARLTWQKISDNGRPGDLEDNDELDIIREPWPKANTRDLLSRAIMHADIGGTAFMVRDTFDGVDQIKFLRPDWVKILMSGDPRTDAHYTIEALIYLPGGDARGENVQVYPMNGSNGRVAIWAPIPDPQANFRGMSWFEPIIREAKIDKAIIETKLRFFQQGARPGILGSFDPSVTPEQAAEFQRKFAETKTGAYNAYKPLIVGGGVSFTTLDLKADDFEKISGIGELRVASAGQVPPTLAGLSEGMKGSSLNEGNFRASKDSFADGTLRPLWGSFCGALEDLLDKEDRQRLWYDERDISFLRQDQKEVAMRKQADAMTITRLVQDGFKPDAAVKFVMEDDLKALLGEEGHSGLYSVQLTPAGVNHMQDFDGVDQSTLNADKAAKQQEEQAKQQGEKTPPSAPPKKALPTNAGTGSARKPSPGRPPKKPGA